MAIPTFLFTGIAGLNKQSRLENFRRHILTERLNRLHPNSENFEPQAEALIPIIELVHVTENDLKRELYKLFGAYQRGLGAFDTKIKKLRTSQSTPIAIFVHTHLTNFVTGHFRSWLGIAGLHSLFEGLEIKRIVNLIDNIHVCRAVVHRRGHFPLTLDQLITWRDAELMMTEVLAGQLPAERFEEVDQSNRVFDISKLIAVDTCINTVSDLLFEEEKFQLYTAYPISKIRDIEFLTRKFGDDLRRLPNEAQIIASLNEIEDREEKLEYANLALGLADDFNTFSEAKSELEAQIHDFRLFFSEHFIVYDPATIDEMPLIKKAEGCDGETIRISRSDSWPLICPPEKRFSNSETLPVPGVEIPISEIAELEVPIVEGDKTRTKTSVGRQVRSRDLRLIEQSDGVIAFRPTLGRRWSKGVQVEIDHCRLTINKPFFIIKGLSDGRIETYGTMVGEMGDDFRAWDLSSPAERHKAFEHARGEITRRISDEKKVIT